MKKGLRRGDIAPLVLLCLTWLLILMTWGVNLLPQEQPKVPQVDVAKMKRDIREAGLEPREARYYRVLPEGREEK
jgi:hypothetical protein